MSPSAADSVDHQVLSPINWSEPFFMDTVPDTYASLLRPENSPVTGATNLASVSFMFVSVVTLKMTYLGIRPNTQ